MEVLSSSIRSDFTAAGVSKILVTNADDAAAVAKNLKRKS
jgi:hypothetical protein